MLASTICRATSHHLTPTASHHLRPYYKPSPREIDLTLMLVTDRKTAKDQADFEWKVLNAVRGGVTTIQIRDENKNLRESVETSLRLAKMMEDKKFSLIINNQIEVALAASATGVHLGATDFPPEQARTLLGSKAIIGLTVNTLEEVKKANEIDIDYLGIQLFPSAITKLHSPKIWGPKGLSEVLAISRHRIVVIGGINADNITTIFSPTHLSKGANADGVAMVGQLWRAQHPELEARRILKALL